MKKIIIVTLMLTGSIALAKPSVTCSGWITPNLDTGVQVQINNTFLLPVKPATTLMQPLESGGQAYGYYMYEYYSSEQAPYNQTVEFNLQSGGNQMTAVSSSQSKSRGSAAVSATFLWNANTPSASISEISCTISE